MRIVVALGGNALTRPTEPGAIPQQFLRTRESAAVLADLIDAGHQLIVTHGNGPQVGNVMRRVEIARSDVYPLPLDIAVADTQGGMGYMIAQCLMNETAARGRPRSCTAVVTTVLIDPQDPAFAHPDKPIGSFLSREDAQRRAAVDHWTVAEDAGRGWRRVVPSPRPREVIEMSVIRRLVDAGECIVACGGGGIPVARGGDGSMHGVEAVVDKDCTSVLLALGVGADLLLLVTAVDAVQADYGTPAARALDRLTIDEASALLGQGQFAAGSMAPKIEAAVTFLQQSAAPQPSVVITSIESLASAMSGRAGTRIERATSS